MMAYPLHLYEYNEYIVYTQVLPICEYNVINKQIKTKDLSLDIVINVKIIGICVSITNDKQLLNLRHFIPLLT